MRLFTSISRLGGFAGCQMGLRRNAFSAFCCYMCWGEGVAFLQRHWELAAVQAGDEDWTVPMILLALFYPPGTAVVTQSLCSTCQTLSSKSLRDQSRSGVLTEQAGGCMHAHTCSHGPLLPSVTLKPVGVPVPVVLTLLSWEGQEEPLAKQHRKGAHSLLYRTPV